MSKDNDDDLQFVYPYSIQPRLYVPEEAIHHEEFDEELLREIYKRHNESLTRKEMKKLF